MQEEDADVDGDPQTSEGIFVFSPAAPDVNVGDLVQVTGTVAEYVTSGGASSQTQLASSPSVTVLGTAPLPALTDVSLPVAAFSDLEPYEGMRVRFAQPLVIAEYFNFDRFGEIVLALPLPGQDRPYQPTSVVEPGAAANALQL